MTSSTKGSAGPTSMTLDQLPWANQPQASDMLHAQRLTKEP